MTRKRAPQNSSKSQSPFLVANKASFDVLKLLDKIEEKKVKEIDQKANFDKQGTNINLNITDDPSLLVERERWEQIDKFWSGLEPKKLQWEKKKMQMLIKQGRQYLLPGEKDEEGEFARKEEEMRKKNTIKMKSNMDKLKKQKTINSIVTSANQSKNDLSQNSPREGSKKLSMYVEA